MLIIKRLVMGISLVLGVRLNNCRGIGNPCSKSIVNPVMMIFLVGSESSCWWREGLIENSNRIQSLAWIRRTFDRCGSRV